jgi:hypothetical protein
MKRIKKSFCLIGINQVFWNIGRIVWENKKGWCEVLITRDYPPARMESKYVTTRFKTLEEAMDEYERVRNKIDRQYYISQQDLDWVDLAMGRD